MNSKYCIHQYHTPSMSPYFPDIQTMVDYILEHPEIHFGPVFYGDDTTNGTGLVACEIEDVILNGKPRRKFINRMNRIISYSKELLEEASSSQN